MIAVDNCGNGWVIKLDCLGWILRLEWIFDEGWSACFVWRSKKFEKIDFLGSQQAGTDKYTMN